MHYSLLYDIPVQALYVSFGLLGVVAIFIFLLIIFVEAIALRLLKWRTFGLALLDAFLMNVASALIGCAIPAVYLITDSVPGTLLGLAGAWVLSIGIEGGVLTITNSIRKTKPHPARQTWLASVVANTASYVLLGILILSLITLDGTLR